MTGELVFAVIFLLLMSAFQTLVIYNRGFNAGYGQGIKEKVRKMKVKKVSENEYSVEEEKDE